MDRGEATRRFYELLEQLEVHIGGSRRVGSLIGRMRWPDRGVCFFFEPGERRSESGSRFRVVHVGTHAVSTGSKSTFWGRVHQHRGTLDPLGGNHRGSVFRKLVGEAMMARTPSVGSTSWGEKDKKSKGDADSERRLEVLVSRRIGQMSLLFLPVEDAPGPDSLRAFVKRNTVALLSGFVEGWIDPPSLHWLGNHSPSERVRCSGLWNRNNVDDSFDPRFLGVLHDLVRDADSFRK